MNKIKFWLIAYLIKSISVKQANTLAQWDDFQEYAEKWQRGICFPLAIVVWFFLIFSKGLRKEWKILSPKCPDNQ